MSAWSRAWRVYAAIWALTAMAAAVVASSSVLGAAVREHDALALTPGAPRSATTIAAIAVHNLMVVGWPQALAALGLARWRFAVLFDAVVAASTAANCCVVGAALGAYGVALMPWLVHLPIESAALALGVAAWWGGRRGSRTDFVMPTAIATASLAAALLEVVATP